MEEANNAIAEGSAFMSRALPVILEWAVAIVTAALILFIGLWVAKKIRSFFRKALEKRDIDKTLVGFAASMLYGLLVVFVVIAAIGQLGIQTTSLVAVIGAAGLAIGLALQGSLSNFAAGVLLILFKPFRAGEFIKAGGEAGIVVEVGILTTEMKTPDNVKIIMPNSQILDGAITNVSAHPTRRVDMTIGVGYSDDLNLAKKLIEETLDADSRVLKDPAYQVAVSNLGDSSVDFVVRPWVNASDFWGFKFDFIKAIKEKFDAEGVSIPFPQRDVHLIKEGGDEA